MKPRIEQGRNIDPGIVAAVGGTAPATSTGTGWFGPGTPSQPLAQAEALGRLLDYPSGYNFQQRPRAGEAVEFAHLRGLADGCDVLRLVIETRKDQVEALDWDVKARAGASVDDATLDAVRSFLLQPSSELDWSGWVRAVMEDLLVLDAVAIYPRPNLGGGLYSLDVLDAANIRRVIDDGGRTPLPPSPAYIQQLKGVPAASYTSEELVYFMRNPRSHKLYGYSPVEQIILHVNMAIRKAISQLEYYTAGNIPESLAGVPDTWTVEQIKEFQSYWDLLIEGNTAQRRKMKFVPIDPGKIKETRQVDLKDMFDEWLARVACYAFSVSPSPFIKDQNRATAQTVGEQARSEGLVPLARFLKRRMDLLIARHLRQPGIEFHWDLTESINTQTQANVDSLYVAMKVLTPDELRRDRFGKEPLTADERAAAWPAPAPMFPSLGAPTGAEPEEPEEPVAEGVPTEKSRRAYGIGKLVVAPVIHVPERSVRVDVGDVNVTAQVPQSSPMKENV